MNRSLLVPALFFTLVTFCAYSCWALGAKALGSPMALYIACTVVFLFLGPLSLYSLVRGQCGFWRFAGSYLAAFLSYAAIWVGWWQLLPDKHGEIFGFMFGLAAMSAVFRITIGRPGNLLAGMAILFFTHSAGYYSGEIIYQNFLHSSPALAKLAWGLGHGLGFGTGLAFLLNPAPPELHERQSSGGN